MSPDAFRLFRATSLLGVLLSIPSFVVFGGYFAERRVLTLSPEYLQELKPGYYDASTAAYQAADRNQIWGMYTFWGRRSRVPGISLRLLENPELLESFFPGYPAGIARSPELQSVVTLPAAFGLWSPRLRIPSLEGALLAPVPWEGGLRLYEGFGADVVVIGSSRVFMSVVPKLLSTGVAPALSRNARVLVLGEYLIKGPALLRAAERMRRSGKRAKLVILGYPQDQALEGAGLLGEERTKLQGLFKKLEWRKLVACRFCNLVRPEFSGGMSIGDAQLFFPKALAGNLTELERFLGTATAASDRKLPDAVCDLKDARAFLELLYLTFSQVADRVLLYTVPEIPLAYASFPDCFAPAYKRMTDALRDRGMLILNEDWKDYGLDPRDFVHASTDDPSEARLDFGHTNYYGAVKVTRRLSRAALEALAR